MQENPLVAEGRELREMMGLVGTKVDKAHTPVGISLVSLNPKPLELREIFIDPETRGGNLRIARLEFATLPPVEEFSTVLSPTTNETLVEIAQGLEVEQDVVFRAAALTRTLMENPSNTTAVYLEEGLEFLAMAPTVLPASMDKQGIITPSTQGYRVDYFTLVSVAHTLGGFIPINL